MSSVAIHWPNHKILNNAKGLLLEEMPKWVICRDCGCKRGGEPRNVRVQVGKTIYLIPHTKIKPRLDNDHHPEVQDSHDS